MFAAMDIKFGHIYCHECEDYAYDKDFERISRALRIQNAMRRGMYILKYHLHYIGWFNIYIFNMYSQNSHLNQIHGTTKCPFINSLTAE